MSEDAVPLAYSEDELIRLFPISKRKLFDLRKSGQIPHIKLGRRVLYPAKQVAEWVVNYTGQKVA